MLMFFFFSIFSIAQHQFTSLHQSMQSGGGIYDHMQPNVNINGVNMSPKTDQQQNQMMQSQHLNAMPPQNQFLQSRNTSSVSAKSHFMRIDETPKIQRTNQHPLAISQKIVNEFSIQSQELIRCSNQILRVDTISKENAINWLGCV